MKSFFTHPALLVFLGGGSGSWLRYQAGQWLPATSPGRVFPIAILLVNVLASGVLGAVMGWGLARLTGPDETAQPLRLLVGMGFCGGLSTFSSFSYDTLALWQQGRWGLALLNIALNLVLCGAGVGRWIMGGWAVLKEAIRVDAPPFSNSLHAYCRPPVQSATVPGPRAIG